MDIVVQDVLDMLQADDAAEISPQTEVRLLLMAEVEQCSVEEVAS